MNYFVFYDKEKMHQSLDYKTPDEVYYSGNGGGTRVVDKYSVKKEVSMQLEEALAQRHSSA